MSLYRTKGDRLAAYRAAQAQPPSCPFPPVGLQLIRFPLAVDNMVELWVSRRLTPQEAVMLQQVIDIGKPAWIDAPEPDTLPEIEHG